MQLKRFIRKAGWSLLALVLLTGCEMLKGFGQGLENAFKQFKFP